MQVHFTLHGCHHKFPLDRGRLVFPPLPAAACAAGLRAACRAALPPVRSRCFCDVSTFLPGASRCIDYDRADPCQGFLEGPI